MTDDLSHFSDVAAKAEEEEATGKGRGVKLSSVTIGLEFLILRGDPLGETFQLYGVEIGEVEKEIVRFLCCYEEEIVSGHADLMEEGETTPIKVDEIIVGPR
ncbi:hypothetical protein F2Q70_00017174 [Brassica cretica]|uniref:Uncharacterized protein n=1 Tax=Brassica cretica TaxID=69181 RepID=A0A8S9I2T0_BRACR|nr:hypothetical protein F2Q70_00017174 [Brassica cretica]KAF2598538.1 hypothetical protein F2Q68_00010122 [Brassica cretica]